jgi:hypothetical protein
MEQRAPRYVEHVGLPRWAWALTMLLAFSVGFAYLGYVGPFWALVVMLALAGVLAWWLRSARAVVSVDDDVFTAGRARLPLQHVGTVTPLDAEAARRLGGVDADARAYLLLRGAVPTAVRVDVDDPADPTPYWLVSTARPAELTDALLSARAAKMISDG